MPNCEHLLKRLLDPSDLGSGLSDSAKALIKQEIQEIRLTPSNSGKSFALQQELFSLRAEVFALREKNKNMNNTATTASFTAEQYAEIVHDICALPELQNPESFNAIAAVLQRHITVLDKMQPQLVKDNTPNFQKTY